MVLAEPFRLTVVFPAQQNSTKYNNNLCNKVGLSDTEVFFQSFKYFISLIEIRFYKYYKNGESYDHPGRSG